MGALGLEVRAGLHTGECELLDGKVAGICRPHRRARSITSRAKRDPRLEHVRDLVAGSGISFEDRGSHELLRVPGGWRLYAVDVPQSAIAASTPAIVLRHGTHKPLDSAR